MRRWMHEPHETKAAVRQPCRLWHGTKRFRTAVWRAFASSPATLGKTPAIPLRTPTPTPTRLAARTLGVLLEGVRHRDGPVAQVLPVHGLDGGVARLKAVVRHEAEAARVAGLGVAHDLGRVDDDAERAERVVQQLVGGGRSQTRKGVRGQKGI